MSFYRGPFPVAADYATWRSTWRGDVLAGITVGIVALPLALAFGLTTGAMTVVLVPIVTKFGVSALAPLGLVAGALVVFMGVSRCGGLINKVPWPVMEGFTLGIAIVIALQQLPTALATKNLPGANTIITAWRTL